MQWDAIPFLGIVFFALMLLPLWMLISGIRHKGRIRMMVGGACFVVVFAFGVFLVDSFCSRHERILDHGTTTTLKRAAHPTPKTGSGRYAR